MPKEHRLFIDIPRLYKRQCLDHIMYGYVNGLKRALPSMSIRQCIKHFVEDNELSEDDYALNTAHNTYFKLQRDYYDSKKTKYNKH